MIKTKQNAAQTIEMEVPNCPYCGAEPLVEVQIKKENTASDTVSHTEVNCYCCGLGAPLKVWEELASKFTNPIAE